MSLETTTMKPIPTKDMYCKIMKFFEVQLCTKAQMHKNMKKQINKNK